MSPATVYSRGCLRQNDNSPVKRVSPGGERSYMFALPWSGSRLSCLPPHGEFSRDRGIPKHSCRPAHANSQFGWSEKPIL